MKNLSTALFFWIIFFGHASFAQQDSIREKCKWEVGIKMNTMKNNIWDPFEVDGNNIKNLGWFNGAAEIPHSRNTQFSFGVLLRKERKSFSFNLRVDYSYKKSYGIVGPFPTYPDTLVNVGQEEDSRKSSDITISPQIEFNLKVSKVELSYGIEIPWTDYGNAKYFQNSLIMDKNTGEVIDGGYQDGELAYGYSIGLGLFAGFYFSLSPKISIGGLFFSSIDYYVNNGVSYENIETINPTSKDHIEDKMNIRATVYQPVNISFILSYKINSESKSNK